MYTWPISAPPTHAFGGDSRTHSQASVGSLLWGHCSFLLGPSAHKVLFDPSECLQQVWGLNTILLLLTPWCGFPLPLDMGYLFLVGSNILPWIVVQQLVIILKLLQEKMSTYPPILPSWLRYYLCYSLCNVSSFYGCFSDFLLSVCVCVCVCVSL